VQLCKAQKSRLGSLKNLFYAQKVDLEARKKNIAPKKSSWKPEKNILSQKSRLGDSKNNFWAKKVNLEG